MADDQPKSTHIQKNGLPDSAVHTPHPVNTVIASASNSQALSGSGNGRRRDPGNKVTQKKSPLKKSRSGYGQTNGANMPLQGTRERMGEGGEEPRGLYINDLAALLVKISELEERLKPKAENE